MSASIAQTWTSLPPACRTGASGIAGPANVSPGLFKELPVRGVQKVFVRLDLALSD